MLERYSKNPYCISVSKNPLSVIQSVFLRFESSELWFNENTGVYWEESSGKIVRYTKWYKIPDVRADRMGEAGKVLFYMED